MKKIKKYAELYTDKYIYCDSSWKVSKTVWAVSKTVQGDLHTQFGTGLNSDVMMKYSSCFGPV